jgi:DNA-directed RNA polymerase subunit RPC12/RpoP
MARVEPKKEGADYRCQDCGMVITVKDVTKKTQHGELLCCNRPMEIV